MKIAVATDNNEVTKHFGHCATYNMYTVEDNKIVKEEIVANPGHKPGFLPKFLGGLDTKVIISGGMGGKAVDLFNGQGIEVVIGASGPSKNAVQDFLDGKLASAGSPCAGHGHGDDCED